MSIEPLLPLLQCPDTGATGFTVDARGLHCSGSGRSWKRAASGWWDLAPWLDEASRGRAERERIPGYARLHEPVIRPALTRVVSRQPVDTGLALVERMLRIEGASRVLDLGCGTGRFVRQCSRLVDEAEGGVVLGVDRSGDMLDEALRRAQTEGAGRAVWFRAVATRLPLRDASITALHSGALLGQLGEPRTALAELARVLAPGGRLVVTSFVASARSLPRRVQRLAARAIGLRLVSPENLPALLAEAGLSPREEVIEGGLLHLCSERLPPRGV